MDAVIARTSAVLTGHFVATKHVPGPIEDRILGQVSGERMAYEAAEVFMNETSPNEKISSDEIRVAIFQFVKNNMDAKPVVKLAA